MAYNPVEMTVVEQIKTLSQQLSPQQRAELVDFLGNSRDFKNSPKPESLRGIWKDKFSSEVDVSKLIEESRNEWKREFELTD